MSRSARYEESVRPARKKVDVGAGLEEYRAKSFNVALLCSLEQPLAPCNFNNNLFHRTARIEDRLYGRARSRAIVKIKRPAVLRPLIECLMHNYSVRRLQLVASVVFVGCWTVKWSESGVTCKLRAHRNIVAVM